ncbi:MAG: 50S ribosomal protein L25/general stress protein Ctc [Glaciimonas sp.]|nr:50S ribosomal protein L25/general stress protein Ctc [Glaciimonas sp.]
MKVIAFKRTLQGTGASRRLRITGQTPGIVYGGTEPAISLTLDHNALYHALKKEAFHASILDLEIDGKVEKVLLRDFQVHAFKQLVLHVDFQRVDANQKIHVKVPLHFINADIAPVVKLSAGIVSHVMTELEIACLPANLPESITVDLATLEAGDSIHLSSIVLPEGVSAIVHGDDPTIATGIIPAGTIASTDAEAEAGTDAGKEAPAA